MEIVIDTSALIAVIAEEKPKRAIVRATAGVTLIAPVSVHYEIGNALSSWFKRRLITLEEAIGALEFYQKIAIRLAEVDLGQSLRIAKELDLYAYDAYIIECALRYRAPLLTLDVALAKKARGISVDLIEVI